MRFSVLKHVAIYLVAMWIYIEQEYGITVTEECVDMDRESK